MSEPRPNRLAVAPALFFATLTAVIVILWWREGANERRVDDLLEMAYDYTELGGEQPTKLEHSENRNLGEAVCGDLDDWYTGKTAGKSVDGDDALGVAEDTAQRFENEGWVIQRLVSDSEVNQDLFTIIAEQDRERVVINFFEPNGISILAQSGPCLLQPDVPANLRPGRPVIPDATAVDRFPQMLAAHALEAAES